MRRSNPLLGMLAKKAVKPRAFLGYHDENDQAE